MPYVFRYKGKRFFSVITQGKSTWKFFVQSYYKKVEYGRMK